MFASLNFLRHCRLSPVFPSCTFGEFRNLSQTSSASLKILQRSEPREFGSFLLKPSVVYFSSQPRPSEDGI